MPELIISGFSTSSGIATEVDKIQVTKWEPATALFSLNSLPVKALDKAVDLNNSISFGTTTAISTSTKLITDVFNITNNTINTKPTSLIEIDTNINCVNSNQLQAVGYIAQSNNQYILQFIDVSCHLKYDPLTTIEQTTKTPWNGLGELIRLNKKINYGYSVNKFLVGGGSRVIYPVDEEALDPPDPNEPIKVIKIVNDVSIVTLPARTALNFDSINLGRQIDSFAWSADITLLDQASFDLVKPTASTTVEIEISINGTVWNMFVSRGSKAQQFGSESFTVKAFSKSALLQDVYTGKISVTNNSASTPATLINDLITSYGFTSVWDLIPSWTIPQYQFSVQNKSPIEAVATIANSIGAVIEPDLLTNTITIKPWCETNPWQWNGLTGLPSIDANLSYQVSEDYSPQAQANAIYVTGQENGVATKCVISGTAGDVLLPSVSDKLITDTIAAQERGRIELAKSGHKENVPLTTYIDEAETLLMPGDMITVNNVQATAWNGMVTETSITVANEGLEVYQTLTVLRHYN